MALPSLQKHKLLLFTSLLYILLKFCWFLPLCLSFFQLLLKILKAILMEIFSLLPLRTRKMTPIAIAIVGIAIMILHMYIKHFTFLIHVKNNIYFMNGQEEIHNNENEIFFKINFQIKIFFYSI